MTELNGTVSPSFEPVRDAVAWQLRRGTEVGLSLVADACYWPEFAVHGKEEVEVRHLLSHTSGVSGLARPARLEDLYDVRTAAARMAAQPPWWRPGSASGYHVLNYGHLIGELVYRLTGESLREFVHEHIAKPLGADFHIGLRSGDISRVADVVTPSLEFDPSAHGNALSVAEILAPIARSPADGGLLEPSTVELIFDQQSDGVDLVNGLHLRWGIGYALPDPRTLPWLPGSRIAYWDRREQRPTSPPSTARSASAPRSLPAPEQARPGSRRRWRAVVSRSSRFCSSRQGTG